jgi:hypothetical protein
MTLFINDSKELHQIRLYNDTVITNSGWNKQKIIPFSVSNDHFVTKFVTVITNSRL